MLQKILFLGALLCVHAATLNPSPSIAAEGQPPEFRLAIESAKNYLQKSYADKLIPDNGRLTISALALLKADTPPASPLIQGAANIIRDKIKEERYVPKEGSHDVYEASVDLMFLESLSLTGTTYQKEMEVITKYLVGRQGGDGSWDYNNQEKDAGDTSMTQFAMLGLWSSRKAGIPVSPEVWDKCAGWHIRTQFKDGGFYYHPARGGRTTHSMTTAAACSLLIIRRHLYPNEKGKWANKQVEREEGVSDKKFGVLESAPVEGLVDEDISAEEETSNKEEIERQKAIEAMKNYKPLTPLSVLDRSLGGAIGWLNRNYTVTKVSGYTLYYFYGLERTCALGSINQIANRDWYYDGGLRLLQMQNADSGGWQETHAGDAAATSYALLFFTKATAQMLGRTPRFGLGAGILQGARGLKDPNEPDEEDQSEQEKLKNAKKEEPIDKLLTDLMNPKEPNIAAIQQALVENVNFKDPEGLIGQKEILLKMAEDPRMNVKQTAMWALGRTGDLSVIPVLIDGLLVENVDVNVEALLSLCFMSRRPNGLSDQDISPTELIDPTLQGQEREAAVQNWREAAYRRWKKWYFSIRPYDQREDIEESLELK
ncbi:MAG: hypothetical protein R3C11_19770 [Planctomycetaceae bacterium]